MDSLAELYLDMSGNRVRQRGAISAGICLNSIKNLKVFKLCKLVFKFGYGAEEVVDSL